MNKEFFKDLMREKDLRLSQPRFLIYQELSSAGAPRSARELYRSLHEKRRKVGLTSIYRCLDLFESLGIAFKVSAKPNVRYRLCDSNGHHHHIVCKKCGRVVELNFCDISDWAGKVTRQTGYEVTEHQLSFYGFCETCKC